MPARALVTEGSPSRSCECNEVAAEETADGTGEGEGGVMCGSFRGGIWGERVITSTPEKEDERPHGSRELPSATGAIESGGGGEGRSRSCRRKKSGVCCCGLTFKATSEQM